MARSRYSDSELIDGFHLGTWRNPAIEGYRDVDMLEGVRYFEYVVKIGDRLDHLAAKHLADESYWWVIAVVNKMMNPLDLSPGQTLRIPFDVRDVLRKVLK